MACAQVFCRSRRPAISTSTISFGTTLASTIGYQLSTSIHVKLRVANTEANHGNSFTHRWRWRSVTLDPQAARDNIRIGGAAGDGGLVPCTGLVPLQAARHNFGTGVGQGLDN
jgi:hypothetical protein